MLFYGSKILTIRHGLGTFVTCNGLGTFVTVLAQDAVSLQHIYAP